jgi:hypothetical protein
MKVGNGPSSSVFPDGSRTVIASSTPSRIFT